MNIQHGSLINVLMENAAQPAPNVGDGATILCYSDRHAATITEVRKTAGGKLVVTVQQDSAERVDTNGMSESQEWRFSRNPKGTIYTFRQTKNGRFTTNGGGYSLRIGDRDEYYDYSF